MAQPLQIEIKSSIVDRRRLLTIEPDYIEFDDTELRSAVPTRFAKEEIVAWRYGTKWIRGYQFYIGRIYCIDLKSSSNHILKIRLKTIYGVRKQLLASKYSLVWNAIQTNFIRDISRKTIDLFFSEGETEVLGVLFANDGVRLDKDADIIPWFEVGTKNYATYYSIYSITNPQKHKAFDYLIDWNTSVLYSVSRSILKSKNLWSE